MNIIYDVEILKVLLPEPTRSMYVLERELTKRLGRENVNYPTLRRHIRKLKDQDLINIEKGLRKNGKTDQRGTKNLSLTFKGLVYLILKAELTENESRAIINRVLARPHYQKLEMAKSSSIQNISVDALKKSFYELKPKVNLEYFDEDYVKQLFLDNLIMQNCLDLVLAWMEEARDKFSKLPDKSSRRELKMWKKKAKKDIRNISNEEINLLFEVYNYLRAKQGIWNEKIDLLQPIVKYLKKKKGVRR